MDITAITVNFKTPALLATCVASFRAHYPGVTYIVVDNGGCEESDRLLTRLATEYDLLVVRNSRNLGHGPALNEALALAGTRYAFTLDSDTETKQGGFLDKMVALFEEVPHLFACGWRRWVNTGGVPYREQDGSAGVPYIHPYACLLRVDIFRGLAPFALLGAPANNLMRDALVQGWALADFPVSEYVWHKGAGTRGHFQGRLRPPTDAEPGNWNRYRV